MRILRKPRQPIRLLIGLLILVHLLFGIKIFVEVIEIESQLDLFYGDVTNFHKPEDR